MLRRTRRQSFQAIENQLQANRSRIRFMLQLCVRCAMCAESCFLYRTSGRDPRLMPSHKMLNSVGTLYRRRGKASQEELEAIRKILWHRCVLCMRCYCPLGVDIPGIIALGRSMCRTQDLYRRYDGSDLKP